MWRVYELCMFVYATLFEKKIIQNLCQCKNDNKYFYCIDQFSHFANSNIHVTPPPPIQRQTSAPRRVVFVEGVGRRVRCVSSGGYPSPELSVYLGPRDVTRDMTLSSSATLYGVPGVPGVPRPTSLTLLLTESF